MSVPRPAPDAAASSILTFLIADVRGYTAYTRDAGDEAAARLATAFAEIVREGVEARDGRVIELRGDEALAVFASPRQALRAASELQDVFADEIELDATLPLRVGIGLDAGEAVPVEEGYRGGALNLAARLCSLAGPGETIASAAVVQLARAVDGLRVETREPVSLKGLSAPIEAFTIALADAVHHPLAGRPRTDPPAALDPVTPLVGRDAVARWLRWSWRRARRGPGRAVVIVGPDGSGKTRLAAVAAEVGARDGAVIRYASAAGNPGDVARMIETTIGESELALLVVDDIESAAAADLAAVEGLARAIGERRMLVVALSGDRPAEPAARALRRLADEASTRRLGPLGEGDVASIVELYATDPDQPPPVRAILEASGGVPAAIHALAADWAQGDAARRLGVAASQAAERRRDLRHFEAEVATNVVDLQLARERHRLYSVDPTPAQTMGDDCPFKGLASFEVADADVFFGRERLVAETVGRLAGTSFLGVVGPSGSGKSSAVKAGLIPALGSGALPGSGAWTKVLMRPGERPMRELDRALFAALSEAQRQELTDSDDPLAAAAAILGEAHRPLIVVDQFEELFTTTADPEERDRFIRSLTDAAATGRAVVVVAVRADFYGHCAADPALAASLGSGHVLVGPMTPDEYRRAIEGPARSAGLRIDPSLVDALVGEVVDEPGGLPLLSTALVELWERRTGRAIRMSAYVDTGGVRGAVGRLAEAAYGRLTEPQRLVARSIFLRLAAGEGEAVVRQRVPLVDFDAATNDDVAPTLSVLTEARLVTVDDGSVEVAHEALLREWPRLVEWLEDDREGRRLRRHLADSAREWAAAGRDAGELYRGARLSSALDWTAEHTLELNDLERQFITESRATSEQEADRQRRTNRRLRIVLAAAAGALVIALGAGVTALAQRAEAEQAAVEAEAQRAAAEQAATAADAQRLGAQALVTNELDLSLLLAREGFALDDSPATRSNLLAATNRSPAAIAVMRPLAGRLTDAVATRDGTTLVVTNNSGESAIIDAATGQTRWVYARTGGDGYVGLLGDDRTLVVLRDGPRRMALLDLADGTERGDVVFEGELGGVFVSSDASTYAGTAPDGSWLQIRDARSHEAIRTLTPPPGFTFLDVWLFGEGHVMGVLHEGALPDDPGQAFDQPATLAWYEPGSETPAVTIALAVAFDRWTVSPDLRYAAVANDPEPGSVTVYDLRTGVGRPVAGRHSALVQGVAFSPDGRLLGTGGDDRLAMIWETESGTLVETLAGHDGRVFAPAFSDVDGRLTAFTPSLDGTLIGWDLSGERRLGRPFEAGPGNELGVVDDMAIFDPFPNFAVSPDGAYIAIASTEGVVIRDATTHEVIDTLPVGGYGSATDVAWSPDGSRLAVAGTGDAIVQLWDPGTWDEVGGPLRGPSARRAANPTEIDPLDPAEDEERVNLARAVAFSPDGQTLAAGTEGGEVWLWDATTGDPAGPAIDTGWPVYALSFDPTGELIAAAFNELRAGDLPWAGKASVWSVGDRSLRYTVSVDDDYGRAGALAFSPDGRTLATGGGIGEVRFWDAVTGAAQGRPVLAAAGWVLSIDWHPTEPTIVTAATDGTVRMIDTRRRAQTGTMPGIDNEHATAAFTGQGSRVLVVYAQGRGFDWTVDPADWARHACAIAGRTLTEAEWEQYLPDRPYAPACR